MSHACQALWSLLSTCEQMEREEACTLSSHAPSVEAFLQKDITERLCGNHESCQAVVFLMQFDAELLLEAMARQEAAAIANQNLHYGIKCSQTHFRGRSIFLSMLFTIVLCHCEGNLLVQMLEKLSVRSTMPTTNH